MLKNFTICVIFLGIIWAAGMPAEYARFDHGDSTRTDTSITDEGEVPIETLIPIELLSW